MEENDRGQRPVIVAGVLQEGIARGPMRTRGLRPSTEGVTSLHDLAKAEARLAAIEAVIDSIGWQHWQPERWETADHELLGRLREIHFIVKGGKMP